MDLQIDHFIQVNLLRLTRIRRISFLSVQGQGKITSAFIEISFDGINWARVEDVEINYREEDSVFDHSVDLTTRYLRIHVKNFDVGTEDQENKIGSSQQTDGLKPDLLGKDNFPLIALKLQLFGCYLEQLSGNEENIPCSSDPPISWFSEEGSFPSRNFAVNSRLNIVLACESFERVKKSNCFVSPYSNIGFWLRIGDGLISRILGYDPQTDYFLVRDAMDRVYLLTRDGSSFHPISDDYAEDIMSVPKFEWASFVSEKKSTNRGEWFANRDFIFGRQTRPVALWSHVDPVPSTSSSSL